MMRPMIFLASILVLLMTAAAQETIPTLPPRTGERLYQQLGICTADRTDLTELAQALNGIIQRQNAEILSLKAKLSLGETTR